MTVRDTLSVLLLFTGKMQKLIHEFFFRLLRGAYKNFSRFDKLDMY